MLFPKAAIAAALVAKFEIIGKSTCENTNQSNGLEDKVTFWGGVPSYTVIPWTAPSNNLAVGVFIKPTTPWLLYKLYW